MSPVDQAMTKERASVMIDRIGASLALQFRDF